MLTYMLRWALVIVAAYYLADATAGRALRSIDRTLDHVIAQIDKAAR